MSIIAYYEMENISLFRTIILLIILYFVMENIQHASVLLDFINET